MQGLDLAVDDHRVQALFAAEVFVHDGFADLCPAGDVFDAGAVEAALSESGPGHPDQLVASFGAGHPDTASTGPGRVVVRHGPSLPVAG